MKRKPLILFVFLSGILLVLSVPAHFEIIHIPGVSGNLLLFFSLLISFPCIVYMTLKKRGH